MTMICQNWPEKEGRELAKFEFWYVIETSSLLVHSTYSDTHILMRRWIMEPVRPFQITWFAIFDNVKETRRKKRGKVINVIWRFPSSWIPALLIRVIRFTRKKVSLNLSCAWERSEWGGRPKSTLKRRRVACWKTGKLFLYSPPPSHILVRFSLRYHKNCQNEKKWKKTKNFKSFVILSPPSTDSYIWASLALAVICVFAFALGLNSPLRVHFYDVESHFLQHQSVALAHMPMLINYSSLYDSFRSSSWMTWLSFSRARERGEEGMLRSIVFAFHCIKFIHASLINFFWDVVNCRIKKIVVTFFTWQASISIHNNEANVCERGTRASWW